jgi:hypothetical protein
MSTADLELLPANMRERLELLHPESVGAVVAWLADPSCQVSGELFSVAGPRVCRVVTAITEGVVSADLRQPLSTDFVRDHFDEIRDLSSMHPVNDPGEGLRRRLA